MEVGRPVNEPTLWERELLLEIAELEWKVADARRRLASLVAQREDEGER